MASTESNRVKRLAYQIEARKMSRYERDALGRFHHVIAVSEHDRQQMLAMDPDCAISVVPTGVDTQKYGVAPPASANPPRIVFTGSMDWEPNIDAVTYFCQEVFPACSRRVSFRWSSRSWAETRTPASKQLASPSVEVTGTVPSVGEYLRGCGRGGGAAAHRGWNAAEDL